MSNPKNFTLILNLFFSFFALLHRLFHFILVGEDGGGTNLPYKRTTTTTTLSSCGGPAKQDGRRRHLLRFDITWLFLFFSPWLFSDRNALH